MNRLKKHNVVVTLKYREGSLADTRELLSKAARSEGLSIEYRNPY